MRSENFVEKIETSRKNSMMPEAPAEDIKIPSSGMHNEDDLNDSEEVDRVLEIAET